MSISLKKGGKISLSKEEPSLVNVHVGLGWDERSSSGVEFDLDASVFALGANGKVRNDQDFIFYNNLKSTDGSIEHTGDNRTGAGDGDDEVIKLDLPKIPANVDKLAFVVTIHDGEARQQNFGQVDNAYIRILNNSNQKELVKYNLSERASVETAMIFAEIYRYNGEWRFKAMGQACAGGLHALALKYGVNV